MDKKEIQKLYQEKIKLLNRYNQYYYDKNKPLIDDKNYDELKISILSLEKKYNFLASKKSPSINGLFLS